MEFALKRVKARRRMSHQVHIAKVFIEQSLVAMTMLIAVCVLASSSDLQAVGAGCFSLWFTDACASVAVQRDNKLFHRITKQSVQLAAHVIIALTGVLTTLPLGDLTFGIWFAAFLLEIRHLEKDLEATVMLFSHFACLTACAFVPLHFSQTALVVTNAADVPVAVYKVLKLYHEGKSSVDLSWLFLINIHIILATVLWCPIQLASFTLHGLLMVRYMFAQVFIE